MTFFANLLKNIKTKFAQTSYGTASVCLSVVPISRELFKLGRTQESTMTNTIGAIWTNKIFNI